jgi:rhomboid family GlyGly-CTERM serine protease
MKTAGALTALAFACMLFDGSLFEWSGVALAQAEPWRIVTCHFTHWTYEQLAWDALVFAALGIACARRDVRAFHATLLASAALIPFAVSAFAPQVSAYRGLSGIDSALFALLLVQLRRSPLAIVCAIGFIAKITFEASTGGAVFASDMGVDVIAVPVAHVAGALIGLAAGTIAASCASYTEHACASSSPCSSH